MVRRFSLDAKFTLIMKHRFVESIGFHCWFATLHEQIGIGMRSVIINNGNI